MSIFDKSLKDIKIEAISTIQKIIQIKKDII